MTRAGEDLGLFELGQGIAFARDETATAATAKPDGRRPEAGVRIMKAEG